LRIRAKLLGPTAARRLPDLLPAPAATEFCESFWSFVKASLVLLLCLAPAFAAAPPVPRTADGHPDLSGVWQGGSLSLALGAETAQQLEQSAQQGAGQAQDMPPPYQPWAATKRKEYLDRRGIDDPIARCLLPGVPRATYMPMPIQISESAKTGHHSQRRLSRLPRDSFLRP
jgi:hypothetical protein